MDLNYPLTLLPKRTFPFLQEDTWLQFIDQLADNLKLT